MTEYDSEVREPQTVPGRVLTSWRVGMIGLAIGIALALRVLIPAGWDPTVLLAFGENSTVQNEYARSLLGEIVTRPMEGHDGKYFFIQAVDPFYLEPWENAVALDRPRYRAQRMLYPTLAGLGGVAPVAAIPWMMIGLSVLALGVGSWATAEITRRLGGPPWVGLAFALNMGLLSEFYIGGAGVVAFAFGVLGVLALERGRGSAGSVALAAAALTRGAMLLFAVGVAALLWRRGHKRAAVASVTVPLIAVGGWWAYVAWRLGDLPPGPPVSPFDLVPFRGLVGALDGWIEDPFDLAFGVVLIVLMVAFAVRATVRPSYLGWGALAVLAMAPVLSVDVWQRYFDISRALAPVLTAYVVVLFTPGASGRAYLGSVEAGPSP